MLYHYHIIRASARYAALVAPIFVMVGGLVFLSRLLADAAENAIPVTYLGKLFLFTIVKYTPQLLVLSIFFGILIALHQAANRKETLAWMSAGLGRHHFIIPILGFAAPGALIVAIFSLYTAPWAVHQLNLASSEIAINLDVGNLPQQQFNRTPGGSHTYYHAANGDIYFFRHHPSVHEVIITKQVQADARHSLTLLDGNLYRLPHAATSAEHLETLRFSSLRINLPTLTQIRYSPRSQAPGQLQLDNPKELAEFVWRLNFPLVTLALSIIALLLVPSYYRRPHHYDILLGIILFFFTLNFLRYLKDLMEAQTISVWLAIVAAPALIAALAFGIRRVLHPR